MGKVINFKRAAKKISKIKREKKASEKRVKHGQNKLTSALIKRKKKTLKTHLDNHKMDKTDSENNS